MADLVRITAGDHPDGWSPVEMWVCAEAAVDYEEALGWLGYAFISIRLTEAPDA